MSIIIIQNGEAKRVPPAEFALESAMQEQIAANPNILPLHEVREGAELVVVVREFPVNAGYIDLLGFDAEGEIYVIETKLARNPDRRTVVAQALDYGAALWIGYPEPAEFIAAVNELRSRAGGLGLRDELLAANAGDETAADRALGQIATNLRNGAFRFVIPMDRIHDGLKDMIRYLNENSRFTLYLVELEHYQQGNVTVVVPRLFGAESRKSVSAGAVASRGRSSNDAEFLNDLDQRIERGELDVTAADAIRTLLRLVIENGESNNWKTGTSGRVNVSPRFPSTGAPRSPFTLGSDGWLVLNFGYVSDAPAWRDWIPNVVSTLGLYGDSRRYPQLRAADWAPHASKIAELTRAVLGR